MKIQRENHAPFISKEMRKAVYTRSRLLTNKFCKNPSEENQRNIKDNGIYVYLLGAR